MQRARGRDGVSPRYRAFREPLASDGRLGDGDCRTRSGCGGGWQRPAAGGGPELDPAPAAGGMTEGRVPPRATYRLQLHAAFGFDRAAALADYLADLGVSHLYA